MIADFELEEYYRATGGKIKYTEYFNALTSLRNYGIEKGMALRFIQNTLWSEGNTEYTIGIIRCNGNEYTSMKKFLDNECRGIVYVKKRLEAGDTLKQAIHRGVLYKRVKEDVGVIELDNGEKYSSFSEMCKVKLKSKSCMISRINKGFTLEEALKITDRVVTFYNDSGRYRIRLSNGLKFVSLRDACRYYGKDAKVVRLMIEAGAPLEMVLTSRGEETTKIKAMYLPYTDSYGRVFKNVSEALRWYEVSQQTYEARRRKKGWSLSDAIELPVNKRILDRESFLFENKRYKNIEELCKERGKSLEDVVYRLNHRQNIKQAIDQGLDDNNGLLELEKESARVKNQQKKQ